MVQIEIAHIFPVTASEAFAYITDTRNWPEYWPDFVRFQDPPSVRWGKPGDEVTIVLKLLNRERALNMTLEAFQPDARVAYRSHQQGLPDARHERHFTAVPEGVEYRVVVAYEPRNGWRGLFDRLVLQGAVRRALRKTIENIDQHFEHSIPLGSR